MMARSQVDVHACVGINFQNLRSCIIVQVLITHVGMSYLISSRYKEYSTKVRIDYKAPLLANPLLSLLKEEYCMALHNLYI